MFQPKYFSIWIPFVVPEFFNFLLRKQSGFVTAHLHHAGIEVRVNVSEGVYEFAKGEAMAVHYARGRKERRLCGQLVGNWYMNE